MSVNEYDYVIVGGGTAGLVLASRLTENASVKVLVVEAGVDNTSDPRVTTPALFPTLFGSEADWNFQTTPQSGLNGRVLGISHGKILGGSSAINGMAFVAPSKNDIDLWESLGNPGWNWDVIQPYFLKSHTRRVPGDPALQDHYGLSWVDKALGGVDGPIQTRFPEELESPLPKAWISTLNGLGHEVPGDPYGAHNITGVYALPVTVDTDRKERSYAANAYFQPVRARDNLELISSGVVDKVVFSNDKQNDRAVATGVQILKEGKKRVANARKEVILCAGAIHSPKILELSGIGKRSLLQEFGIPVIVSNDFVGENLQDHPQTGLSFEVVDSIPTIDGLLRQDPVDMAAAMEAYATSKSGPLANGGIHLHACLPLVKEKGDAQALKDLIKLSTYHDEHPLRAQQERFIVDSLLNPCEGSGEFFTYPAQANFGSGSGDDLIISQPLSGGYYSIAAALLHPLSRGSTHIQSADMNTPPRVDSAFMAHPLDLEVLARHMLHIADMVDAQPLKSLLKEGGRRNTAAPKDIKDLAAMKEYVRNSVVSAWHPTSTCAMLPKELGGVVDSQLRVYGTTNLRVVDASIMPLVPRANTVASVYMIAERAADLIRKE